mgnify:CR=1 FL=1
MQTDKPKMTIVFSNEEYGRLIDNILREKARVNGTNRSQEAEKAILNDLLPKKGSEARRAVERMYLAESIPKIELISVFHEAAKRLRQNENVDFKAVVELASRHMIGVDLADTKDVLGQERIAYLKANWTLVCDKLHEVQQESPDSPVGKSAGADEKLARAMIGQSGSVLVVAEPKQFFDIVLLNWMALRELEQTYLALASVINLTVGWGKTAKVYEDMRMLFKSIDDMY